jgi:hypothetical protein
MERPQVQRRVIRELCFARVVLVLSTVKPWPDDESLQTLLRLSESNEIDVCDLRAPGIVPAGRVLFRHLFVFGKVIHDAGTGALPEAVVISVAQRLNQPCLVRGCKLQRRGSGTQRQSTNIILNVLAHLYKPGSSRWV